MNLDDAAFGSQVHIGTEQGGLLQQPELVLEPLRLSVDLARSRFLAELATLPEPFGSLSTDHYMGRLNKAQGRPLLGEYVPWLIAESLRIPYGEVESVSLPWLLLYANVVASDDVLDKPAPRDPVQIMLSGLLFERAISQFRGEMKDYDSFWPQLRKYYEETVLAGLHETRVFHDPAREFTSYENVIMGRKSAVVKACATALSLKKNGRTLSQVEETGFDDLCTALQLFDDLSDWEEDLQAENFTYPLNSAFSWLANLRGISGEKLKPSREEIFASLILSGAAAKTVGESNRFLIRANKSLAPPDQAIVHTYINLMAARNERTLNEIERMLEQAPQSSINRVLKALETGTLTDLPGTKEWQHFRKSLDLLMLASS